MKNELEDEELKYAGRWGKCRRFKDRAKSRFNKMLPSAFRKLQKLEKQSQGGAEDIYRTVK